MLLVPTNEQKELFMKFAYYSALMYNTALQWNIDYHEKSGEYYTKYDMMNSLVSFKKCNTEFSIVPHYVLVYAISDLSKAFSRHRSGAGFPRCKNIDNSLSFGVRNDRIKLYSSSVKVPGVGVLRCKHTHWLTSSKSDDELAMLHIHNPRIKFDGKFWFLIFSVEVHIEADETTDEVVGVDLGIINTIYTSNGVSEENINKSRRILLLERRLNRLQRVATRKRAYNAVPDKRTNTCNLLKVYRSIALLYRRLHNIRENYMHKIVNKLVQGHPKRIVIEDLKVRNMLKLNSWMAKAIQSQQFYRIRMLLIEKALNTASIQVCVARWNFPSSKRCSRCGNINAALKLSDRVYKCDMCGLIIDRDYNASLNLRNCTDFKVVAN